jgi:hypothetical protein
MLMMMLLSAALAARAHSAFSGARRLTSIQSSLKGRLMRVKFLERKANES